MGSYNLRNFRRFSDLLEPGEEFVAGLYGLQPGGLRRAFGSALGALGAPLLHPQGQTWVELPEQFVLGLTGRRIVAFDAPRLGGRPKVPLWTLPLTAVSRATYASATGANRVTIEFHDLPPLEVEVQKACRRRGPGSSWTRSPPSSADDQRAWSLEAAR